MEMFWRQPTYGGSFETDEFQKSEHNQKHDIDGEKIRPVKVRMGYCPSMEQFALSMASSNENIALVRLQRTADALYALKQDNIEIALVGRPAIQVEISQETTHTRLMDGHIQTPNKGLRSPIAYYKQKNRESIVPVLLYF